jgi:hypothetical protein
MSKHCHSLGVCVSHERTADGKSFMFAALPRTFTLRPEEWPSPQGHLFEVLFFGIFSTERSFRCLNPEAEFVPIQSRSMRHVKNDRQALLPLPMWQTAGISAF